MPASAVLATLQARASVVVLAVTYGPFRKVSLQRPSVLGGEQNAAEEMH